MKRIILIITILLIPALVYSANQWQNGSGEDTILGTTNVSDIDTKSFQNGFDPLNRLLGRYQSGATVTFNSTTAIDFTRGEVSCQNTGGTITRMRANTSTTTLTNADLDVGVNFANSTTYYVYGVCDANANTFTGVISANSSTPDAGAATYYKLLGSFATDGSGNIIDGSIEAPAESPDIAIETVYDYNTSSSSSTTKTTGVFIAFGRLTIAGSSSTTVTNLPFTSSSTYQVMCTITTGTLPNQACYTVPSSGSSAAIHNAHTDSRVVQWVAVGY